MQPGPVPLEPASQTTRRRPDRECLPLPLRAVWHLACLAAAPERRRVLVCWLCALSGWPAIVQQQPSSSPAAAQARGRRSHPLGLWQALQYSFASSSITALAYAWLSAPASWDPWHSHQCLRQSPPAAEPSISPAAPARPRPDSLGSSPSQRRRAGSRIANGVAPRYSAWLPSWTGLLNRASRCSRALRGPHRTNAAFPNPGPRLARLLVCLYCAGTPSSSLPTHPNPTRPPISARPPSQLGFDRLDHARPRSSTLVHARPARRPPLAALLFALCNTNLLHGVHLFQPLDAVFYHVLPDLQGTLTLPLALFSFSRARLSTPLPLRVCWDSVLDSEIANFSCP